ncbi:Uncharacterized protein CTA2_621 [Colletotrichum tanaceti]|nr:Uncharacterized protein CTA2_621 [Colletotrichum tanaceti]
MHIPVALRSLATAALFTPWNLNEWVASDDTVRNGTSQSALDIIAPGAPGNPFPESIVNFHGTLDYETLGGAGFASQRTANNWPFLDLSAYDTITLEIPYADGKRYTFNLKDIISPPVNGVEQSGLSWEFSFQLPAVEHTDGTVERVVMPISEFVPTLRGRVQNDTAPLDLTSIKRISIMIRSFFAEQDGDFELHIKSVTASKQGVEELRST